MKKILATCIGISFASFLFSQNIPAFKVRQTVSSIFAKTYPGISVVWEKEDENYEAVFVYENRKTSIVYSSKGKRLETETAIKLSELPVKTQEYLKKNHRNAKIEEVSKILDKNNQIIYEIEISGKEILFDSNGTLKTLKKDA
jgi:hypothetical protein